MCFHWSGLENHPGIVTLVGSLTVWYILAFLACLFAIYVMGSLVWQIRDYGVKRRRSGQSPEQFLHANEQLAAEQVSKAMDEWRPPPELNLPMPRPVRSGHLRTRLLQTIPFILLLMFLAFLTWQTTWRLWPSAIVGGVFVLIGYFIHRKELRLLKWGKPARAVVTSITRGLWNLEYRDAAGNLIKGNLSRGSPPKNPVLTVLYDPDRPRQFIPYPVPRYRIAVSENS